MGRKGPLGSQGRGRGCAEKMVFPGGLCAEFGIQGTHTHAVRRPQCPRREGGLNPRLAILTLLVIKRVWLGHEYRRVCLGINNQTCAFTISFASVPSLTCHYKDFIRASSKTCANTDTPAVLSVYCWAEPPAHTRCLEVHGEAGSQVTLISGERRLLCSCLCPSRT